MLQREHPGLGLGQFAAICPVRRQTKHFPFFRRICFLAEIWVTTVQLAGGGGVISLAVGGPGTLLVLIGIICEQ